MGKKFFFFGQWLPLKSITTHTSRPLNKIKKDKINGGSSLFLMGLLKEEKVKLKESWFAYYTVVVPIGVLMDWIDWTALKMIKTSSCL